MAPSTEELSSLVWEAGAVGNLGGAAVDIAGNVYIADEVNNAIYQSGAATQQLTTLVSSGLREPTGVAVDGSGNVYIADTSNSAIKEWSASTQQVTMLLSSGLLGPTAVALDGAGNIYMIDTQHAIKEIPYAFVGPASLNEPATAGTDSLLPVLPATAPLNGVYAPTSDSSWLTIGAIANGVVSFSFTANTSTASRVAHISILGQQIAVTQAAGATVPAGPTVVSYSVICGTNCLCNMVPNARVHLPWQITGVRVVFSQPISTADIASLTGVSATGFSGLGTTTLTWTFAGVWNGNLATTLATSGAHAIASTAGTLGGANTGFNLKILEGDMNDDGIVNASDTIMVSNARSASYNIYADINGDGVVDINDVQVVRTRNGQSNR